ncbi:MAG: hypothetical protein COU85_00980 [Candidatus Portnoybacteria bacterium CG10_big_fil_rev_8_21_14_0_10_44_7]|uniref:Uncharacterized protein n=1 Tax=Candidatus Portnoybacteria bacterium CG10_big_fil_rev_8_21_14_0_10_44_7 TaxID=1974816 RepID=A0A2M8KJ51_9BACT|nr:MAG: hypothetical protein COU85_00980 [Candidatus Portnoybacteria bacterium CG10_big_fil_rev_8_21_14_0_10_44_7]
MLPAVTNTTQGLLDSVNLTPSAWDFVLLGLLILASFLYGLTLGKNRLVVVNLSALFAFLLTETIPWGGFSWLAQKKPGDSLVIFIFFALVVAFFFLLPKSSLTSALRLRKRGSASWWQLWLLGIAQIGMIAAMVGAFLNPKTVVSLNIFMRDYLFSDLGLFIWILVNLALIVFLKKKKED